MKKKLPRGVSVFYRETKKRWVLSYADPTKGHPQKVMPKEIRRERDAHIWALNYLATKGLDPTAAINARSDKGPTVGDCADRWLVLRERDPDVAPATLKGNRSHLKVYILPKFGPVPISTLDSPVIRAWLREMMSVEPPPSASRVRNVFYTLRTLVGDAIAEGWLRAPKNPLDDDAVRAKVPELVHNAEGVRALPLAWVQTLLDSEVVSLERRVRYALGFTSGCRDGELAGLTWGGVDLDGDVPAARVTKQVALVGEKGKGAFAKPRAPKTKSSIRTMPLHPAAIAALKTWRDDGWAVWVGRAPGPGDYVFPRPDGGPSRPRSAEFLRDDLEACELPTTLADHAIEFKDTRSSFATWLQDAGVDETPRKLLMGHTVSDVTAKHYTARNLGRLAEAVAKIDLTWSGTRPTVMPTGTSVAPILAALLAPPAGIGPATFGLGSDWSSARGSAAGAVRAPKKARRGSSRIGLRVASGFGRSAAGRPSGDAVVPPPELEEARAGLRALTWLDAAFEAFLQELDDADGSAES